MPVRSSSSSVLRWPDKAEVEDALRAWALATARRREDIVRVGYFGSYARGDWGVGSDLDILVLVARSDEPFERRGAQFDARSLPVPADVLVYTVEEAERLARAGGFLHGLAPETVWVYPDEDRNALG